MNPTKKKHEKVRKEKQKAIEKTGGKYIERSSEALVETLYKQKRWGQKTGAGWCVLPPPLLSSAGINMMKSDVPVQTLLSMSCSSNTHKSLESRIFHEMEFQNGEKSKDLTVTGTCGQRNTGTTLRFWPDSQYFDSVKFSLPRLKHLLQLVLPAAAAGVRPCKRKNGKKRCLHVTVPASTAPL